MGVRLYVSGSCSRFRSFGLLLFSRLHVMGHSASPPPLPSAYLSITRLTVSTGSPCLLFCFAPARHLFSLSSRSYQARRVLSRSVLVRLIAPSLLVTCLLALLRFTCFMSVMTDRITAFFAPVLRKGRGERKQTDRSVEVRA